MDEFERVFRDGLRDAVRRKPELGPVDLAEVMARAERTDDDRPSIASGADAPRTGLPVDGRSGRPPRARRPWARWAIAATAAAAVTAVFLLLPGRTGSGPIEAVPAKSPSPAATPTTTPTPIAEPGTRWASLAPAPDDMPLVPYFAALMRAEDYDRASKADNAEVIDRWRRDREAFTVQCMAEQGFDYFPPVYGPSTRDKDGEVAIRTAQRYRDTLHIPALDADRAVVAAVGYGLSSTSAELWNQLSPPIDDSRNEAYLASLSRAQRDKWEIALNGQTNDDSRINPMTKGCSWEAVRKYPEPEIPSSGIGSTFTTEVIHELISFGDVDAPLDTDPRLVALNGEWRACMAEAGFSTEELRAHQTTEAGSFDGPDAAVALASVTGDDGTVGGFPAPDDAPADQQSLTGSAPEIRIALADYDCRRATDYEQRRIAVQRDLEEQFVKAHQKELDELLAYVEQHVP